MRPLSGLFLARLLIYLVPRHPGEQQAHAAGIRDAGEHQPRADEGGQGDEVRMNEEAKDRAQQNQQTGGDAHLAFEGNSLLTALDGQPGLFPGEGATLDADDVVMARREKPLAHLLGPAAGAADDVEGLARRAVAPSHDRVGVKAVQREQPRPLGVDLPELHRVRPSINSTGLPLLNCS